MEKLINLYFNILKKKTSKIIMNILRVGVTQILYLNVTEYSAVSTSVDIAKKFSPKLSQLVNAVLRNICRNKTKLINSSNPESNIPYWIKDDWIKNFGECEAKKISMLSSSKPPMDIKIKKKKFHDMDWEKILNGRNIFNRTIRLHKTDKVSDLPYFKEGFWWVQSVSASIPVDLIISLYKDASRSKVKILEIGSAPGGKTFQLCEESFDTTSVEISKKRLLTLKENLKRLKLKTNIIHSDILDCSFKEKFDCILIDAPCSASGILSKKPEILLKKKKILKELLAKQNRILDKARGFLKPNGIIIYVVCSILSAEGPEQITRFIKDNDSFKIKRIKKTMVNNFKGELKNGMLTIKPNHYMDQGGMDGFFIACLENIN